MIFYCDILELHNVIYLLRSIVSYEKLRLFENKKIIFFKKNTNQYEISSYCSRVKDDVYKLLTELWHNKVWGCIFLEPWFISVLVIQNYCHSLGKVKHSKVLLIFSEGRIRSVPLLPAHWKDWMFQDVEMITIQLSSGHLVITFSHIQSMTSPYLGRNLTPDKHGQLFTSPKQQMTW